MTQSESENGNGCPEEDELGIILKRAREAKGLSHDSLAELLRKHGVKASRTHLIRLESGAYPGPGYRKGLTAELDLPPDLFSRFPPDVVRSHRRLSERVDLLEDAVARIELELSGEGEPPAQ